MTYKRFLLSLSILLCTIAAQAQSARVEISARVVDKQSKEPIIGATVQTADSKRVSAVTDINGRFTLSLPRGARIKISYIGYKTIVGAARSGTYQMVSTVQSVNEVVVTARESRDLTATSIIGRQAIDHLQPSSFADLLELLPGGRAHDPNLSSPNTIRLREAGEVGTGGANYATSSLGTQFVVDGAPVSTNANMQYLSSGDERSFVNQGVDMRSISTDDIEEVEIVRGIPSVEYGDLTSGLVKIKRKRGGNNLSARLKADMGSQLFYLGKSFEWKNQTTLNVNVDYLNSHSDPRNTLENYKRVTFSARLGKRWETKRAYLNWANNADYTGSFDNDKTDPDLNEGAVDTYKQSYNRFAFMSAFSMRMRSKKSVLKDFSATLSASIDNDVSEHEKLVQLRRATIAATSMAEGESDATILPYTYMANHRAEGRPFNFFAKLNAKLQVPSRTVSNTLLLGANWNVDKNYGRGQVFDMTRPLSPGMSGRPRDISKIPANHTLSLYAEENLRTTLWGNTLELVAGLRGEQLLNLSAAYTMHGKTYWDPRANMGWTFPGFKLLGQPSFVKLVAGVGQHTKFPTIEQLYPEPNYIDLVEMNYYNPDESLKRIYIMTYVIDPTNHALKPARNLKWELGLDFNVGGNRINLTYFREDMKSGFRSMTIFHPYDYKLYDTSGIDDTGLTAPPSLDGLPYTPTRELVGYSHYSNGSRTLKEGFEYTLTTQRFERIHTRLTINGAWFRTTYHNSQAAQSRPSEVVGNEQVPFVGIYKDDEGFTNSQLNTNFTFDTDIPVLKLGFSLSAQFLWYTSNQRNYLSEYPDEYMDRNGEIHPWDNSLEEDPQLRYLVRNYTASMYKKNTIPMSMNLNLKVTKKLFDDRLMIAMFCNRIWDYTPDYTRDGYTIRRHVTPYFGLEMNIRL